VTGADLNLPLDEKDKKTVGGVHVGLSICIYLKMKLYHFFVRP